jgi:polyhydroxyalkanoate synthesis repressor PhaR
MSISKAPKYKKPNDEPEIKETVLIKKYANRRLYNMQESMYITLVDVRQMVIDNIPFMVVDAKDNTDLTRSILLQIIVDAEQEGSPVFSSTILEQLIRTYSNSMQNITSSYLEQHMQSLQNLHADWLQQAKTTYGKGFSQDVWLEWLNNNQQNLLQTTLDWQNQMLQQNPMLAFFDALKK